MKKYYCCSIILCIIVSSNIYAETLIVGMEEIFVPIFSKISIALTGDSWILDVENSQFGPDSITDTSIISLLSVEEKSDSTYFVVLRKEKIMDKLMFSRNNLKTGQQYIYTIILHWVDANSDIFADMNISFEKKEEEKTSLNNIQNTANKHLQYNLAITDNKVLQDEEQSELEEIEIFSNDIVTIIYMPYEEIQGNEENSATENNTDINIDSAYIDNNFTSIAKKFVSEQRTNTQNSIPPETPDTSIGTEHTQEQAILQEITTAQPNSSIEQDQSTTEDLSATVEHNDTAQQNSTPNDIVTSIDSREQMIQQNKASNQQVKNNTETSNNSVSIDLQTLQQQVEELWNNDKRAEAEELMLSWVQNNDNYSEQADAYYLLANMYENTATDIDDIKKALDFYNTIYTQYILSQHYQIVKQRINELQNTYIFIR